jgi:hypothetical protein
VATPTTPSLPPYKQEDLNKWLYKDPQGEIQGERGRGGKTTRENEREREKFILNCYMYV